MSFELKDKVVVITGGAGGIGSFVVRYLMSENVKHVAILDVAEAAAIALQNEINAENGNKVKFYKCDVTKEDQIINTFKEVIASQGSLDVVINNAGILNDSWKTYRLEIDVNVGGVITGTLRALELMRKDQGGKGGVILNVSSAAALVQMSVAPIYSATKSAVLQFSNCIGLEDWYSRTGVRVIAICFGATDTPLLSNMGCFDEVVEQKMKEAPKKFPAQVPTIAAAGVIEVLKRGESGSTWLVKAGKPAKDISDSVKKAYSVLSERVF